MVILATLLVVIAIIVIKKRRQNSPTRVKPSSQETRIDFLAMEPMQGSRAYLEPVLDEKV